MTASICISGSQQKSKFAGMPSLIRKNYSTQNNTHRYMQASQYFTEQKELQRKHDAEAANSNSPKTSPKNSPKKLNPIKR